MKNRKLSLERLQNRELLAADLMFGNYGGGVLEIHNPWPPIGEETAVTIDQNHFGGEDPVAVTVNQNHFTGSGSSMFEGGSAEGYGSNDEVFQEWGDWGQY